MTYFEVLGSALGLWMILGGAWTVFPMQGLKRLLVKLYPEVRPRWILAIAMGGFALVLWTWWEFLRAVSMENFVVTLVLSIGLAKVVFFFFFYKQSREFLMSLASEPLAFRVVLLSSASIGLALLTMGIFF